MLSAVSKFMMFTLILLGGRVCYGEDYNLHRIFAGPPGQYYLVINVLPAGEVASHYFPVIVRVNTDGGIDRNFGEGGILSLNNWQDWRHVNIADLKVGPDGDVYVLGKMGQHRGSSVEEKNQKSVLGDLLSRSNQLADLLRKKEGLPEAEVSAILQQKKEIVSTVSRLTDVKVLPEERFDRDKEGTFKLFVSRFDSHGQPRHFFGDNRSGTVTVHHVFEHEEDAAANLAIAPNGSVMFSAEVNLDAFEQTIACGRVNALGELDLSLAPGNHGIVQVDHKPFDSSKGIWSLSEINAQNGHATVTGVRINLQNESSQPFHIELDWTSQTPGAGAHVAVERGRARPFRLQNSNAEPIEANSEAVVVSDGKKVIVKIESPSGKVQRIRLYNRQTGAMLSEIRSDQHPRLSELKFARMGIGADGEIQLIGRGPKGDAAVVILNRDLSFKSDHLLPGIYHGNSDRCSQVLVDLVERNKN